MRRPGGGPVPTPARDTVVTVDSVGPVRPILRMYDASATRRFYLDYIGFVLDWEVGEGDAPAFWQVSLGDATLWLSSHHDDGTPGTAVVIYIDDLEALHSQLQQRAYPYLNPGIEDGPLDGSLELSLIDPASNRLRFFQPSRAVTAGSDAALVRRRPPRP
jgi:hypothetical protein